MASRSLGSNQVLLGGMRPFASAMLIRSSMLVGNIGTAYRLRIQVWLLGAVFAGLGWQRWKELRAQRVVRVARLPARGNRAVTGAR